MTRTADEERKRQDLLAALDAGIASGRAESGVWERVAARVRDAVKKR